MTIEINASESLFVNSSAKAVVNKVEATPAIKSLPDGGKDLPFNGNQSQASKDDVDEAVEKINQHVQTVQRDLQFTVDEDSGKTVIKVIDSNTKELIRQIPGEEALQVAKRLTEGANLEIFSNKA